MNGPLAERNATRLSALTDFIQYGYTAKSSSAGKGPKYLRITDIQDDHVEWTTVPRVSIAPKDLARYRLQIGDIVFARSGATVGKSFLIQDDPGEAVFASYLIRVRCTSGCLDPRYAALYFKSEDYWQQIRDGATGTGQPNFNGSKLGELRVPKRPLNEQLDMVERLEALLKRSKNARVELARIPRLAERYKEAVLRAAYDEAEVEATGLATLGEVAAEVRNGVSRRPENAPPGIPVLKISAVRSMTVRMDERRYYVPEAGEDVSRYVLRVGDLLFTRYNGNPDLVANCGMVRVLDGQLIYPDKLIRVRVDPQLAEPEFVEAITAAPQARIALAPSIKSAAGQHGISGTDLKRLPMPLPSRRQQQRIISQIRCSFSAIDRMATESSHAGSLLDRLDQATLGKAFRGELVAEGVQSPLPAANDSNNIRRKIDVAG